MSFALSFAFLCPVLRPVWVTTVWESGVGIMLLLTVLSMSFVPVPECTAFLQNAPSGLAKCAPLKVEC